MAIEDEILKRRKQKRAEEDEKLIQFGEKQNPGISAESNSEFTLVPQMEGSEQTSEKLEVLFQRAESLIDQVNGLYQSFIRGLDSQHPTFKRKQLEQLMLTLTNFSKPTPFYRFRFFNIQSSYNQHKDRWDRLIKDIESGKIRIMTPASRRMPLKKVS